MNTEDKVRRAEETEININEYMNLDDLDIQEKKQYIVTIGKLTVQQQYELSELMPDTAKPTFEAMSKMLLFSVRKTPFSIWDDEKIKWLDNTNRDLLIFIFEGVVNFNLPLAQKNDKKSKM